LNVPTLRCEFCGRAGNAEQIDECERAHLSGVEDDGWTMLSWLVSYLSTFSTSSGHTLAEDWNEDDALSWVHPSGSTGGPAIEYSHTVGSVLPGALVSWVARDPFGRPIARGAAESDSPDLSIEPLRELRRRFTQSR